MRKQSLLGKKFGRLTVISSGKSVQEGKNRKTTWNCVCECGNIILAKTYNLNRGGVQSCGCLRDELKIRLKPNQKFGKLTTVSYNGDSVWECICMCGTIKLVKSDKLTSGKTKSCGCIKKEQSRINILKAINGKRKYKPSITSARRIWQSYCRFDKCKTSEPNISFEDFLEKSQNICFYCGIAPNNNFNLFSYPYYKGSENSIKNGNFNYNGLDRIDNTKPHTKDNCQPCCIICNRAKNNRTLSEMYEYISLLKINSFPIKFELINSNNLVTKPVELIWKSNYSDGNIDVNSFFELSQLNCFYCNAIKTNNYKGYKYNGLDRIDSTKEHTFNNIVPCCKYCNFAKSNLSLIEFIDWIKRIKNFKL